MPSSLAPDSGTSVLDSATSDYRFVVTKIHTKQSRQQGIMRVVV